MIITTTYELGSCLAGLFSPEPISEFILKGQVKAKEGREFYSIHKVHL